MEKEICSIINDIVLHAGAKMCYNELQSMETITFKHQQYPKRNKQILPFTEAD